MIAQILQEWKERQICEWGYYKKLLKKLREASERNDLARMAELKEAIRSMACICGAYPESELLRVLEELELEENDLRYIRNSINFVTRSIDNGHLEDAETVIEDVTRLTCGNCTKCKTAPMLSLPLILRNIDLQTQPKQPHALTWPDICSEDCKNIQCSYRKSENFGRPCVHLWENYTNDKFITRTISKRRRDES